MFTSSFYLTENENIFFFFVIQIGSSQICTRQVLNALKYWLPFNQVAQWLLYFSFLSLYIIAVLAVVSYDTVNFSTQLCQLSIDHSWCILCWEWMGNSLFILPSLVVSYSLRPPYSLEHWNQETQYGCPQPNWNLLWDYF